MEDHSCLRAGLRLLGLDLSRHPHRGGADTSGRHVCRALFDRGHGHARLLRAYRTPHSFFAAPARPSGGGRHFAVDGRQSHAFLRGASRSHRPGGAADCGYAALVSGARQPAAGRPSHLAARQDRAGNRDRRRGRAHLARSSSYWGIPIPLAIANSGGRSGCSSDRSVGRSVRCFQKNGRPRLPTRSAPRRGK